MRILFILSAVVCSDFWLENWRGDGRHRERARDETRPSSYLHLL